MNNAEINRASGRLFKALLPVNWVVRDQEDQEDYGVDLEIELHTPDDKPTGMLFKVQLKGTENATVSDAGELVFSKADVARFRYYIERLPVPLIFIVYDISNKVCYWEQVQGNHSLGMSFDAACAASQKTFTLRMRPTQTLTESPASHMAILNAVASAQQSLVLRDLNAIPLDVIRDHFRRRPSGGADGDRLRLFVGIADLETIQALVGEGDFRAACEKAISLFESEAEALETRLRAGFLLSSIVPRMYMSEKRPAASMLTARSRCKIASSLIGIVRGKRASPAIRRYALLYARAAQIGLSGPTALALAMSEKQQELQQQSMAAPITRLQRMQIFTDVGRQFHKYQASLIRCANRNHFSVLPHAISDVAEAMLSYVTALRLAGHSEWADVCVGTLLQYVPLCSEIAATYPDRGDRTQVLTALATRLVFLAGVHSPSSAQSLADRVLAAMTTTPPLDCIGELKSSIHDLVVSLTSENFQREVSFEEYRAAVIQQATAMGVDLQDGADGISRIVNVGLADLDPTRVLITCEHVCVVCTAYGIPAEMLGLPTAGSKRVTCLKHGHSVEGQSLDSVFARFAKFDEMRPGTICCESCPDRHPRPDGWVASLDWPKHENERYQAARARGGNE